MSVYVGIDVHRKRSQVAVVAEDGTVQLNKNVVNGSEPMLRLIGDLPAGTPVAFEAAFGWGWLARLLEDYGFEAHLVHPLRCKAIASARLAAELDLPAISREVVTDCLAVTGRPGAGHRPDRRRAAPARQGRPAGQGPDHAAGRRPVHCPGHAAEIGDITRFGGLILPVPVPS
jgi:hypothetical protein